MLVFIHIHKCGGSSLQSLIRRNFASFGSLSEAKYAATNEFLPVELMDTIRLRARLDGYVMGHFAFGVHRLFETECQYVTFLRKPIPRLVSLYRHAATTSDAYYHRHSAGRTFQEFLASREVLETDNGMVRFLSGDPSKKNLFINPKPFGTLEAEDLERAFEHLEQRISAFGLLEKFDESLVIFRKLGHLKRLHYIRVNTTSKKVQRPHFDPKFRNLVLWDELLYERALTLFDQRLIDLNIDKHDVYAFQKSNQRRQWLLKGEEIVRSWGSGIQKRLHSR